jgi:DNA-binding HxlR family transcriptional regulator
VLEFIVGRHLQRLQKHATHTRNVEYLARSSYRLAYRVHSIDVDEATQKSPLWYYRATIRYALKYHATLKRIEKDAQIVRERLSRACKGTRWGKNPWKIEAYALEEPVPLVRPPSDENATEPALPRDLKLLHTQPELHDLGTTREVSGKLGIASDVTRLAIILMLARNSRDLVGIARVLDSSTESMVNHHLEILRRTGLVKRRCEAQHTSYALTEPGGDLASVAEFLFARTARRRSRKALVHDPGLETLSRS